MMYECGEGTTVVIMIIYLILSEICKGGRIAKERSIEIQSEGVRLVRYELATKTKKCGM